MTTQKQPQAGEWWESQNRLLRVFVIGIAPDEVPVVCEQDLDPYRAPGLGTNWQHLPDCTGWDWQPEVWPQWYLPSSTASSAVYHRRESKTKTVGVRKDGTEYIWCYDWDETEANKYAPITQQEAEAIIKPQESPDDWVTQDRVPPRDGIDQVRWSDWPQDRWEKLSSPWEEPDSHGFRDDDDGTILSVRCRRKDLPPLPSPSTQTPVDHPTNQQLFEMVANLRDQMDAMIKRANSSPKRVPMRLWIADDGDTSWGFEVAACAEKPERTHQPHEWRELFFDGNGFFVEGQQ